MAQKELYGRTDTNLESVKDALSKVGFIHLQGEEFYHNKPKTLSVVAGKSSSLGVETLVSPAENSLTLHDPKGIPTEIITQLKNKIPDLMLYDFRGNLI